MAHHSWIEADAHISWSYDQAGIGIEERMPAVLGGDDRPSESTNLEGYAHAHRVVARVEEVNEKSVAPDRWPVVYEMGAVIVSHERVANIKRLADEGVIPAESVANLQPEDLRR